jgi:4-amino-4-deoxy-L-arabinose transferase-like glycosyltransferase
MVAVLRGMTATLPIFHGSDERVYQYPTILRFSHQLPFPDLHSYHSAQTPLFHLLMAYVGKVIGYELWRLRLVEVLISYLLALAVFGLLHGRIGIERRAALALTLLFALSPYVFGYSFRLMTDNLALLFTVLGLERFERYRESGRLGPFAAGCVCAGAAVLTRQSTAFLLGVGLLYAALAPAAGPGRRRAAAAGLVALAALPAGLLFLNWHGLVAPGGDPSSCGLCRHGGLEVRTTELTLATLGLYGAVLFAPEALLVLSRRRARPVGGAVVAALVGVALLLAFPASPGAHAAGVIWKAAGKLPSVDGSSLLFWVLVPLSGVVLWLRLRASQRPWAVAAFGACFLVSTLVIRYPWQKYVDPLALLLLLVTVRRSELSSPRLLLGAGILAAAFIAYAADYNAHLDTRVASRPATRTFTPVFAAAGRDRVLSAAGP